jgi:hypothetical protein
VVWLQRYFLPIAADCAAILFGLNGGDHDASRSITTTPRSVCAIAFV